MWVSKTELEQLSSELRRAINGESVEFRSNQEGALSLLRNDLHTFAAQLGAERDAANAAKVEFAEYMENISHQLKTPVTSMMLMTDLLAKNPAPDKVTQQLEWVTHMNSLKAQAEEIILRELVYGEDVV